MTAGRDGCAEDQNSVDEPAASLRRWEPAERTLRVVEATSGRLGVVYGELERVAQLLAEERAKLEKLLRSREDAG